MRARRRPAQRPSLHRLLGKFITPGAKKQRRPAFFKSGPAAFSFYARCGKAVASAVHSRSFDREKRPPAFDGKARPPPARRLRIRRARGDPRPAPLSPALFRTPSAPRSFALSAKAKRSRPPRAFCRAALSNPRRKFFLLRPAPSHTGSRGARLFLYSSAADRCGWMRPSSTRRRKSRPRSGSNWVPRLRRISCSASSTLMASL